MVQVTVDGLRLGPRRRADGVSFPATRSPWRNLQSADESISIAAHDVVVDTLENLKAIALLADSAFGERYTGVLH